MINKLKDAFKWFYRNPWGIVFAFFSIFSITYFLVWEIIEPTGLTAIDRPMMNKWFFWHIVFTLIISLLLTIVLEIIFRNLYWKNYSIKYECHNQVIGWGGWKFDGELGGSTDNEFRMEAIKIHLGHKIPSDVTIVYETHIEGIGWSETKKNGQISGTTGKHKRLEAIKIKLNTTLSNYSVIYSIMNVGSSTWSAWVSDGDEAGSTGNSLAIKSIRILILKG